MNFQGDPRLRQIADLHGQNLSRMHESTAPSRFGKCRFSDDNRRTAFNSDIFQSYNKVYIRWTTHRWPKTGDAGLSIKDLHMARFCNEAALEEENQNPKESAVEDFDVLGKELVSKIRVTDVDAGIKN